MIKRCFDKKIISGIINHPKVINWLTDDYSPVVHDPIMNDHTIYLVDEGNRGVIRIDPLNNIACVVHIATTPELWGSAINFAKDALSWSFNSDNTRYQKAVAYIPEYNKLTIKLVRDIGFSEEGYLKKSFLKNWKLYGQMIFGISKGDQLCHQ